MNDANKIDRRWARILVTVLLSLGALLMLFPFFWMISGSLKTIREITSPDIIWWPAEAQWSNYVTVLTNPENPFGVYFRNSIIVSVANTVFTLLTTILGAFAFSRLEFKGRDRLFSLLMATMMVPSQMYIITNFITITRMHLMDSLWAQILPYTASIFYIYLLRQFFNQIPDQIYLAAKVDGCSDWKYLWKMMVPNARSSLVTIGLFNFIASWNAYLWPLMVTNTIQKRTLSIGLKYFASDSGSDYHLMMAGATIVVLPLIVIYLVFQKYIIQGIARGGLKG
ncbi:MAG: carbohydrate ABC transporter permease [Spirochaetes bacterium]|uniref:Carbohydrate ABC transporter permease n=1 Tax=Candidatus Aphodenecus pullistercoris TaxID=2840669 RepID=A0A9D9E9U2_9SPIR|nr:carbohydrate ABC transporter permease [Candidatus Aphodenecus pullistercoris]